MNASLGEVRLLQGKIMRQIMSLGFSSKEEKNIDMLMSNVLNSFMIGAKGRIMNRYGHRWRGIAQKG